MNAVLVDFAEQYRITQAELAQFREDGSLLVDAYPAAPAAGIPYGDVFELRRDVFAILTFSYDTSVIPQTRMIPEIWYLCGCPVCLDAISADTLASAGFGRESLFVAPGRIVILADAVQKAFLVASALLRCLRIQNNAALLHASVRPLSDKHLALHKLKVTPPLMQFPRHPMDEDERGGRRNLIQTVRRAFRSGLFSPEQGSLSVRIGTDRFIITPHNGVRDEWVDESLVLVVGRQCEIGKTPSWSALLHAAIYAAFPEIGAVLIASPPALMTYAVTDSAAENTVLPRLPFGSSVMQPELFIKEITGPEFAVLIENDCVLLTARTLEEAYLHLQELESRAQRALRG